MACQIIDCEAPVLARGWCSRHYQRWARHGDPEYQRVALKLSAACRIEGCPGRYYGHGYCSRHYGRWYRSGDPLGSTLADPGDRFAALVEVDEATGCWLWTGAISDTGYGNFWLRGGTVLAHRYSWARSRALPFGMTLDHLCRVRRCVNPAHLEPVTQAENNRRARAAARDHRAKGIPA